MTTTTPAQEVQSLPPWLLVIGLLGVIAIAFYMMSSLTGSSGSKPTPTLPAGVSVPQPWQYDAATDQHWDPSHQHWHNGRPPVSAVPAAPVKPTTPTTATAPAKSAAPTKPAVPAKSAAPAQPAASPQAAPKPWQYDAVGNKHWDPAHQHWHGGPPPPQASRP